MDGTPGEVNLSSVDLNLLVLLDAILEEASVTRGAERVGLSQPAMSHALRRIRKLFDDEILVRRGARSVLTPRAERLRVPLQEVLSRMSGLLGEVGFDPAVDTREVTVALNSTTAFVLGAALTTLVAEEAPGIRLRLLVLRDLSDALFTQAGVDLMLLSEAYPTDQPRHRLYEEEWVVVGGMEELTDATAPRLLAERRHVVYDSRRPLPAYEALRAYGIRPTVHARVNDTLLVLELIAGSDRVGLHRSRAVGAFSGRAPLWTAAPPFPAGGLHLDAVWNPWLGDRQFREWFQSVVERSAAAG
jgi:LysR family transcriptional regulator, nod-box dependent transcriptional activator